MKPLTIGTVAREAGVGVETIRFYERAGLIDDPRRRPSGYREYGPDVVRRIRFIRHAKDLGFTLREIKELLELRVESDRHCGEVLELAQAKIAGIEQRIDALQRMKQVLSKLTTACRRRRPTQACPILEAIDVPAETAAVLPLNRGGRLAEPPASSAPIQKEQWP